MNNRRIFDIYSDFDKVDAPVKSLGSVKELDGVTLIFECVVNDIDKNKIPDPMDLSDCVARLYAKKSDKTGVYQKDGFRIYNGNKVEFICADEIFSTIGETLLELEIIDLDGYIVTSPTYSIKVVDKINNENDREIIRVAEITIMEELKDYVISSAAEIDRFKVLITEMSGDQYQSLLEQVVATKNTLVDLAPTINSETTKLREVIDEARNTEIEINNNESSRETSEATRVDNETERQAKETIRAFNEGQRVLAESERVEAEKNREINDKLLNASEDIRKLSEEQRQMEESKRQMSEEARDTAETMRQSGFAEMREDIAIVEDKVNNFSANGNFTTDVVVKGNLYTTLDGKKPVHFGPATKNAGNVLMPYARAVGGFTKDGSGVRTIGFIAKPMDANPSLDITEEQNADAVFLGTNVSQLFLYSKEKYPTIVSEGELSPIATQDWVMRLVEGLGLLNGTADKTPAKTTSVPSEFFNLSVSEQWSTVPGEWRISDENKGIMMLNGDVGLYKPLIGNTDMNEISYVKGGQIDGSANDLFIGLWKTENYIYGCRIGGKTLNISYFGTNGIRGGASSFTLRESLNPGDVVTMHYNFSNDIWEIYKFDPNNEPILVYQMSKFMMSGFPEFLNGKNVIPVPSVMVNTQGGLQLIDCPNPDAIRNHGTPAEYIF